MSILIKFIEWIAEFFREKTIKYLKIVKPLRDKALKEIPKDFAELTYSWKESGKEEEENLRDNDKMFKKFEDFVNSKQKVAVITGRFGTGKTYLCKYLAGKFAKKFIPIYIDSSRFASHRIHDEITNYLRNRGIPDIAEEDLSELLKKRKTIIFFDGLDQLPYLMQNISILNYVIEYILGNFLKGLYNSRVFMVVREEFYKVSPEFQNFVTTEEIPICYVKGLSDEQIKNFIKIKDKTHGDERWLKVNELLEIDKNLRELFCVPVILERFISIDIEHLREIKSTGVTLSRVYKLSFDKIRDSDREFVQNLAYYLYVKDRYLFRDNDQTLLNHLGLGRADFINNLNRIGIFPKDGDYQFEHPSFRDYFAAERILEAIKANEGEKFLSERIIHYLVSEFLAGLIDLERLWDKVVIIADSTNNDLVRNNLLDLLTEIESEDLRRKVTQWMEGKLREIKDEDINEKLFFLAIAGAYGFDEPILEIIDYIKQEGIKKFLDVFFVTKENFKCYGGSYDRFILEWIKCLKIRQYKYLKILICYVLGELKIEMAKPHLEEIIRDENEDLKVKTYANESLMKLNT